MRKLRSQKWFDDPAHADMTALYVERFMNYGLTREELQSGRPIIGIAQTGSDLAPCNRHHIELAQRTKAGIRDAGGIPMEFPVHPLAEQSRRPTAALDRNLLYLGLVEILYGYPIDAVVRTLDFYKNSNLIVGAKKRIADVNLKATDTSWSTGNGPEAEGPAMSLLMVMTGRPSALTDLTGPGVETLQSRL